jgi:hypothetical protein
MPPSEVSNETLGREIYCCQMCRVILQEVGYVCP